MKKTGKFIAAMTMALAVLISANPLMASARTETTTLGGRTMTMSTSISYSSASAQTYAGLGQVSTSVNASYAYINVTEGSDEDLTQGTKSASSSNYYASTVSFSAPEGCRSVRISASHSFSWSGVGSHTEYTSEDY